MLCKGGVPILISGSPSFGQKRTLSQLQKVGASGDRQTNYFDNEKAPVVRTRDRGTAPVGSVESPTGGSDSRPAMLLPETDGNGTEQRESPKMPTVSDGGEYLQDSDGSKTLKTIWVVLGSSR